LIGGFELALDRQGISDLSEGEIRDTPAYMAPEQARGRHQDIGPATDIYGLGAILYEMLTGRTPFQDAPVLDLLTQVIEKDPEPLRTLNPGVDSKLEAICNKCLRKPPAERYANGLEPASRLRAYVAGLSRKCWFSWQVSGKQPPQTGSA